MMMMMMIISIFVIHTVYRVTALASSLKSKWSTPLFQMSLFLTMFVTPKDCIPQMPNSVYMESLIKFKWYKGGLLLQWRSCIAKVWPQIRAAVLHICSQPAFVRNHWILQLLSVYSLSNITADTWHICSHYPHLAPWFCSIFTHKRWD